MRPDTEPLNPKLMNCSVKTLAAITISFLLSYSTFSQVRLKSAASISADVKKVVEDFPNNLANLIGETIINNPQSTDYRCNFEVTGAEESTITRYASGSKPVMSWQAVMLTTEDFEVAKKEFRRLFTQLNSLPIGSSRLKGNFEAPSEGADFASVVFTFVPAEEWLKRIRVEIVMEALMMDWKVKVLVYDRSREDNERGPVVE